ncbi:MAG TPA: glycosyltransferase family 2 protein [Candidatus Omnitrophota bacterium]|nr:glycosyltransferase family 2 protein [Candidatus Omnitrophota bacterium]HPS36823.1 glycosyltransferase family 2 protein [Candidatus Omnitrophota bacterium]
MGSVRFLSIVVPVYCEQEVINEFYIRLKSVLDQLGASVKYEVIFVNDCSRDDSIALLKALNKKDASVKVISLARNFGHQIAITVGIDYAKGDAVVVMDGDLQDPPEVIPDMFNKWIEGYKVVYGVRRERRGEGLMKVNVAKMFYRFLNLMSTIKIPTDVGDFRLMDRVVVNTLKTMREENRYVRGLVAWVGFSQTGVYFDRDPRYAGKAKYTLSKLTRLAMSGITSFSEKPLYFSSYLGLVVTLLSFAGSLWIIIGKMMNQALVIQGWTTIMLAIFFFGGVQLFSMGIIGQYIAKIYNEVKRRPLYVIQEKIGIEEQNLLQDAERLREQGAS